MYSFYISLAHLLRCFFLPLEYLSTISCCVLKTLSCYWFWDLLILEE